jgi:hypothetical protein
MSKLPGFFFYFYFRSYGGNGGIRRNDEQAAWVFICLFFSGPTAVMEAYGGTMSKLPGFLFVYFFQVLRR